MVPAIPAPANAAPIKQCCGEREHRPPRVHEPDEQHRREERGRVQRPAHQCPQHLAVRDVVHAQRRGQHGVERVRVLELEEEVERRVEHGAVHRGDGHEPGRHERLVVDEVPAGPGQLPDQAADAQPDREEVQRRLQQAREEQHPLTAVRGRVALHDPQGAASDASRQEPPRPHTGPRRRRSSRRRGHCDNTRRKLRVPHHTPHPTKAPSTRTLPPASSQTTEPVVAARHSSTA